MPDPVEPRAATRTLPRRLRRPIFVLAVLVLLAAAVGASYWYVVEPWSHTPPAVTGANGIPGPALDENLSESDFQINLGPILGCAGTDFFTVTCHTTQPAVVTLTVGPVKYESGPGFFHSFRTEGLRPGTWYEYSLSARASESDAEAEAGPYAVTTFPTEGKLVFAAAGDSRDGAKVWAEVSQRMLASGAAFAIHTGDVVSAGQAGQFWARDFWLPARPFCAGLPGYYVIGNHEHNSPLFNRLFRTPTGDNRWWQRIGPVLLIGIDSVEGDWTAGSADMQWLEEVLAASRDKFVFLVAHYPAYSSLESYDSTTQGVFALLEQYYATAMLAGHAHSYERLEPGRGTAMIVTAGAGAPLYGTEGTQPRPDSKAFHSAYHYCVFTVEGDTCTLQAFGLGSDRERPAEAPALLDTCTWPARNVK